MLKKTITHPLFFFPLLSCVILWPISLQLYSLKNDALTYYYPVRTLISDALHNGELPLWTPFINMGYPLHADMQSGAWNPVIWIFSLLSNYSLSGFNTELLFYFSLAGIGFYYLGRTFKWSRNTALLIAVFYQFSGFMLDSVQFFVCISGAAYLPFIMLFFYKCINNPQWKNGVYLGLFMSLLFTGSYPALFIITSYFLVAFGLFLLIKKGDINEKKINLLIPLASALIAFLILSLPAILSFTQHLSFIERGQHQRLTFTQENSLPPGSLISLINPFSTSASISWIQTDPLMRSSYFGLFPLLLVALALASRLFKFNKNALFFFLAALLCWLLSFGKYFFLHSIAYHYLPLFNTFRHPALLRIISIFSMLIVAGFSLDYLETKKSLRQIKLITQITMILMLAAGFILAFAEFEKLFAHPENYTSLLNEFKSLNFTQRFFLQFPFAFIFIGLTLLLFQQRKLYPLILILSIAEVFVFSQFALPVTVIGSKKIDKLERLLNRNNIAFPLPDLKSVGENGLQSEDSLKICGSTIPYVKRITRNDYYITPGNLKMQDSFYESSIKDKIFKNAFIYIADTIASFDDKTNYSGERIAFTMDKHVPLYQQKNNSNISLNSISANSISTIASSEKPTILVLQQNNYPGWKASIDGQKTDIVPINKAFMAINLPKGKHLVKFSYQPNKIIIACYVTALGWAMLFLYFLFGCRRIFLRKQEQ